MKLLVLCCVVVAMFLGSVAASEQELTSFPFVPSTIWRVTSDNSVPSFVSNPFFVSKSQEERTSVVIIFDTEQISPNEYFFHGQIEALVGSSESLNDLVRIGIIPLGDIEDMTTVTFDTLPRLEEEASAQTLANESGNKIVFDVVDALGAGVRAFELVIIGGGTTASVALSSPQLVLEYPTWRAEPVDTGCLRVETPIPNMAAPGMVTIECPDQGNTGEVFLYLHGAPTAHTLYNDMPVFMQPFGKVILLNLPGNIESGDIESLNGPWAANVISLIVEWVHIRNLTNIRIMGQDFGGPTATDVAHILAPEGRILSLDLAEAVGTDVLMCPDDSTDCFIDGDAPRGNDFSPNCFGRNIDGCGDVITGRNWFTNQSLASDPEIHAYADNPEIGGTFTAIAYPAPCVNHVYNLLNKKCREDAYWDEYYCGGQPCSQAPPTQGQRYWPQSLYTHGFPTGEHNIWTKEFYLRARESMKFGPLSTIAITVHCIDYSIFKTIVKCRASDRQWAESEYPTLTTKDFGGNMGHFFPEDGFNGAYSFARSQQDAYSLA